MTQTAQIECVNKSDRYNPHERILRVGGSGNGGWRLTQSEAIQLIESAQWQFFVSVSGNTSWVIVGTSQWGHKYLKTAADGDQPDNLLSQPECR